MQKIPFTPNYKVKLVYAIIISGDYIHSCSYFIWHVYI